MLHLQLHLRLHKEVIMSKQEGSYGISNNDGMGQCFKTVLQTG
mgnify:CR=1 FL=1